MDRVCLFSGNYFYGNYNIIMNNKLDELRENLAKDLVQFEENQSISEQQMDEITEIYSKVYDIITACDK